MAGFYGQYCGIGNETDGNYGTKVARTGFFRTHAGSGVEHNIPRAAHDLVGFRSPQRYVDAGPISATGKLVVPAAYQGLGSLFMHAFGSATDTGSNPYTHTFKLLEDSPPATLGATKYPSLTVEHFLALPTTNYESIIALGAVITQMTISWKQGEQLKFEFSYTAAQATQDVKTVTPAYKDLDTYLVKPSQVSFKIATVTSSIKSFQLTLDNGLEVNDAYLGSTKIMQPYAKGLRKVSGQIEKFWESKTDYDKFISNTSVALELTATSGAANHSLVLSVPKAVYTGKIPEVAHGGVLPQVLSFEALDDSTDSMLKLVATDTLATTIT